MNRGHNTYGKELRPLVPNGVFLYNVFFVVAVIPMIARITQTFDRHKHTLVENIQNGFGYAPLRKFFARNHRLYRIFPFLRWWPMVTRDTTKADLIAGLTGAAVVLPQGVAFAVIAGMPPEYGLYAAMVPAVIAALFGSSWHLVSGPTTALSIVVFSTISPLAEPGTTHYISLVLTLTFLAGLFQLIIGLARMGVLVNFISHTVVTGFTAGAAILIASSQLKNFFGVDMPRGASFYETMQTLILHIGDTNLYVLGVGATTLVCGLLARRSFPRFPYMIAAMLGGGVVAYVVNAVFGGEPITHLRTVGVLSAGLPPFSHPDLSLETIKILLSSAFAVTILALTEAVSIARAIAAKSEQRIDGSQEFIGQGLSNIAGSFFSGYASSGSFNRSGLNYAAGAKTPLATIFAAGFLVCILLLVAPLAAYLPVATMAAILFLVAYGLIDFKAIRSVIKASRSESAILAATFFATLFAELEFAIYIGVLMSLMFYLKRVSSPAVSIMVPNPYDPKRRLIAKTPEMSECPQLKIVHIDGGIFFGAVDHIAQVLQELRESHPHQKHLLVVATGISSLDIAGAELFASEAKRREKAGGGLYFYGLKPAVLKLLSKGGYATEIGKAHIFSSKTEALSAIYKKLDKGMCRSCEKKIFKECESIS